LSINSGAGVLAGNEMLITYEPKEPLELKAFSSSILSLADEYDCFIRDNYKPSSLQYPDLKIKEIRKGSIVIDLITTATTACLLGGVDNINHAFEFVKNIKGLTEFFLHKSSRLPPNTSTATVGRLIDMVEPIAQNVGSHMNFHASGSGQNNINIYLGQQDANAIQRLGKQWISQEKLPKKSIYEEVLFYWYQTRDTYLNKRGDKGIIESISKKPINTYIPNPSIKEEMIKGDIFNHSYLVNVQVETIEENPNLYKVVELIEVFDKTN